MHRPCSSCISSVQEINEDSIEFSLSTQTWSRFKLSWLEFYKYCNEWSIPLEGILLLERGWVTKEVIVTYMDCV